MNNLAVSIRIAQADAPPLEITVSPALAAAPTKFAARELPAASPAARFVPLDANFQPCDAGGHAYVHDRSTGLIWTAGNVSSERLNWEAADKACKALGEGWRLPTRAELLSLVDDTRHDPCIDTALFPDTKSDWYWTSTDSAWSAECAWIVYFDGGLAYNSPRNFNAFVRAVRAAPAGQ